MKNLFTALFVSIAFIIAGCGSEQETHSHGEDGDHTHEAPPQQSTMDDSEAVHIGGDDHAADHDSTHTHEEEEDHSHEEEDDHSHEEDSTHSHGDEEHSH